MDRRLPIVIAVIGLHVLGLWALQAGLLRRAVELVVPVSVLSEIIEPAQPQVAPTPPPPQPRPANTPRTVIQRPAVAPPAHQALAVAVPIAEAQALAAPPEPQPPAPPVRVEASMAPATPATPATPIPSAPAPATIDLPSSSADYLNNPPPPYPPLSKRLGEQGQVTVRAFIDERGVATRAEVRSSSGFDRLDQAALQTVLKWRYVPGKRAGVVEGMWFNIPIHFVLE